MIDGEIKVGDKFVPRLPVHTITGLIRDEQGELEYVEYDDPGQIEKGIDASEAAFFHHYFVRHEPDPDWTPITPETLPPWDIPEVLFLDEKSLIRHCKNPYPSAKIWDWLRYAPGHEPYYGKWVRYTGWRPVPPGWLPMPLPEAANR